MANFCCKWRRSKRNEETGKRDDETKFVVLLELPPRYRLRCSIPLLISELNFKCCFQVDLIDLQWQFVFTMRSYFCCRPCHTWHEQKFSKYYYSQTIIESTLLLLLLLLLLFLCWFHFVNFQFENTIYSCLQRLLCDSNSFVWSFHSNFGTCLTSCWN